MLVETSSTLFVFIILLPLVIDALQSGLWMACWFEEFRWVQKDSEIHCRHQRRAELVAGTGILGERTKFLGPQTLLADKKTR